MKREGVSTLSICGFPRALRYLLVLKTAFVFVCFEKFCWLYDDSFISPQGCDKAFLKVLSVKKFGLSKYLRTVYLLEKGRYFPPFR